MNWYREYYNEWKEIIDVMQLAMILQEMKNEDVKKVAIEQVKILARLNKDA